LSLGATIPSHIPSVGSFCGTGKAMTGHKSNDFEAAGPLAHTTHRPVTPEANILWESGQPFPPLGDQFGIHRLTQPDTAEVESDDATTDSTETEMLSLSPETVSACFARKKKKRRPRTPPKNKNGGQKLMARGMQGGGVRPKSTLRATRPNIVRAASIAKASSHSSFIIADGVGDRQKTQSAERQVAERAAATAVATTEVITQNARAHCVNEFLERFVANEIDGATPAALSALSEQLTHAQAGLYGVMQSFILEEAAWLAVEEAESSCAACFEAYGLQGDPMDAADLDSAQLEDDDDMPAWEELSPHLRAVYILSDLAGTDSAPDRFD